MRSFILLLSALCASFGALAQFHIGYDAAPRLKDASEITPEQLAALKATTTILFYRPQDEPYLDRMRAALDTVWTVTKLELRPTTDEATLTDAGANSTGYSFFSVRLDYMTRTGSGGTGSYVSSVFPSLALWITDKSGKKPKPKRYAGITLDPSRQVLDQMMGGDLGRELGAEDMNNWSPGLLVNYLACVNDLLLKRKIRGFTSDVPRASAVSKLKKDTLYVLDSALEGYSLYTTQGSKPHEATELLGDYPFPWRIVTGAQLNEMLLAGGRRFFYMVDAKYSGGRFFTVYDSSTGGMVYGDFGGMKYNVKDSDFKALAKSVLGG